LTVLYFTFAFLFTYVTNWAMSVFRRQYTKVELMLQSVYLSVLWLNRAS